MSGNEEPAMISRISDETGAFLLMLARASISQALSPDENKALPGIPSHLAVELNQHRGVFVTLYKNRDLRGCIGIIEPVKTICQGVLDNARQAAFHDSRFRPLIQEELKDIRIEVSILTTPKLLEYDDARDLPGIIRPGADGVIIRKKFRSATFLPQVWQQVQGFDDFMTHLCIKAGLSSDEWKKGKAEILTYQVQFFEEG